MALNWSRAVLAGLISAAAPLALPAAAAGQDDTAPKLTAEQIVEKNVAARGGLEAWRKIRTMICTGHIATGNPSASLDSFVLEYKRPNKTRLEVEAEHEKTVRVFDGARGWKLYTSGSGAPTLKRYSPLELRSAHDAESFDGPLIDHQRKSIKVALDGADEVEGRKAYRLALTLPSGSKRHVWVDAQTFLDLKYDRESHIAGGRTIPVSVFYRSFQAIDGVQMPMTIETKDDDGRVTEKMTIDEVTLNPSLSDAHFGKPNVPQRRNTQPDARSASGADSVVPPALGSK
jgi:outer membrane lipoprotein-sorting protein